MAWGGKRILAVSGVLIGTMMVWAAPAAAQATRTWVSGVGDDVNPCSRTAPCKTFAGAISKTAAGGEINCLDPAGYGAVTITKAMTIDCHFTEGGALAGGNGIVVNAGPTDVVLLRGLDIFGVNPPSNGVRFIGGAALYIEDSVIRRFNAANSQGVSFQPDEPSRLVMTNVLVADNGVSGPGGGILVQPTGAGSARVTLTNVRVQGNASNGIRLDTTGAVGGFVLATAVDSQISNNLDNGISVIAPGGITTRLFLTDSEVGNNAATGIFASGSGSQVRVGNTTIAYNATGVNGPAIYSYGDNRLGINTTTDGAFTSVPGKN